MQTGKVKWFDPIKGYGFIQPDDGSDDIFVHVSDIKCAGYTDLKNDQAATISYEIDKAHSLKLNSK